MTTYRVFAARLTYDEFHVEADTPEKAAYLVANGKVREFAENVSCEHDYFYDAPETIVVLNPNNEESCGYKKVILTTDIRSALVERSKQKASI